MKKILIFLVFCVISITLFISCEKGKVDLPVVEKPTAKLSITPEGVIPYGAKCTLAWASFNSPYCTLNGKSVKPSDSAIVQLFGDTVFTFKAINGNLSDSDEKLVKVGDWTTSQFGLLAYNKPWALKGLKYLVNGEVVADLILDEDQKDDFYYFSKDGRRYVDYNHSGILSGSPNDIWFFSEDRIYLSMGGENVYFISKLTKGELTLDIQKEGYTYNGQPCVFRQEYYRP